MHIRDASDSDLPAILAIHNDAIARTNSIWEEQLADLAERRAWLAARRAAALPVLVCEEAGEVLGYASFGEFRARSGYRLTVEHSVYVAERFRRRGVARLLMIELMASAQRLGKHTMVSGIERGNAPSIALHEQLGFRIVGCMSEVGAKFGRWLDLVFMQKLLDSRSEP